MTDIKSDDAPKCPQRQADLKSLGQLQIRVGGTTPGGQFFLGELADLSERIKPLDLHRCEKCGRLEFYDDDFSLPAR
jgi:hypothetical protein